MFDSAGKYGAGLSLEVLGKILKELGADGDQIIVSNKLGWKRIPLDPLLKVPTFEGSPCIWKDIEHDAVQEISYDGVLSCFHQGNDLLGFVSEVVSIHDPEEYIAAGGDSKGRARCRQDILDAYRALFELKSKGVVKHIGIGSKSVEVVEDICRSVQLDWVMIACSYTIYRHPDATRSVLRRLHNEGVTIINAAVFHAGFLLGGDYFDYEKADETASPALFDWRRRFHAVCSEFNVAPVSACIQFPFLFCGNCISSVALNPGSIQHIREYVSVVASLEGSDVSDSTNVSNGTCTGTGTSDIPAEFWVKLRECNLIQVQN